MRLIFGVFLATRLAASALAISITGGPLLQGISTSEAIVVFYTDESAALNLNVSRRAYRKTYREAEATLRHEFHIKKLNHARNYNYRIYTTAGEELFRGKFKTAESRRSTAEISFAVLGDSGVASLAQYAVASVLSRRKFDFILHTGDIVYPTGALSDYLVNFFLPYRSIISRLPLYPSLGNHDALNSSDYESIYVLPKNSSRSGSEFYYSFNRGAVHFIALDTNQSLSDGSPQKEWLRSDLRRYRNSDPRPNWTVVFFHHPPFSAGPHGDTVELQRDLLPLLEQYRVDLVFSGHDHAYQRTGRINLSGRGGKILYVVSGGGGSDLYDQVASHSQIVVFKKEHHFVRVKATRNKLSSEAINSSGQVIDRFRLEK
ncbi:metallophosphoesterase [bacterium]|nr:metallophosphoesterase [bacterium]